MAEPKVQVLKTKGEKFIFEARGRLDAFRQFFEKIKKGEIALDEVGHIIMWCHPSGNEDKNIPFRVVPILYKLQLLDEDTAVANLMQVPGYDNENEACLLLQKLANDDFKTLFGDGSRARPSGKTRRGN